jgi:hypothetical protein
MPRKSRPKDLVWDTTDLYGNYVILGQATWNEHILIEHPAMANYEALIKSVVQNPHEIRLSTQSNTALAFISAAGIGPRPEGIRALVNYADMFYEKGSGSGSIVTAYPVDIVKYGTPQLGKTIYKKR